MGTRFLRMFAMLIHITTISVRITNNGKIILNRSAGPDIVPDFDSISKMDDITIQRMLRQINGTDLITSLVDAEESIKEAIYRKKRKKVKRIQYHPELVDIDVFDLEINSLDPDEIIKTVKLLEPTFGGINLEDIKAPECFYIEEKLIELMDIPVFHDDQHGTAIISGAGLINAIELTKKDIGKAKMVVVGAGAAWLALFAKQSARPKTVPSDAALVLADPARIAAARGPLAAWLDGELTLLQPFSFLPTLGLLTSPC